MRSKRVARLGVALSLATWACSDHAAPAYHQNAGLPSALVDTPELTCQGCHPRHVAEWRISSHAYALQDPVFQAMSRLGQRETGGALGDFCVKCHTPLGNAAGETAVQSDAGVFGQRTTGLSPNAMGGVTCLVCHSISNVTDTFNAGFELSFDGARRGPIRDPEPGAPHGYVYSSIHEDSKFCGTCHNVINPKGIAVERTEFEWVQSIFNGSKSCQDCHMPSYDGPAAVGHKTRTVHEHVFVGADVSLLPDDAFPGSADLLQQSESLLKGTVEFGVTAAPSDRRLDVSIKNLAGHALPSGATADREMWLELIVKDATGGVVLESGTLDDQGDLRVNDPARTTRPGTDPALILFNQELYFDPGADGGVPSPHRVDFLWEPNVTKDNFIPPGSQVTKVFDLTALGAGHYSASVRLLFRTFAPHLLRRLETEAGLDPAVRGRMPTIEMASATTSFELP